VTRKMFRKLLVQNTKLIRNVGEDIHAIQAIHGNPEHLKAAVRLLGEAIDDGVDLVHRFYGEHSRMGGPEEAGRHWQEGSPTEILEGMYLVASHYLAIIKSLEDSAGAIDESQARDFDRKRIQALLEFALRIQTGKMAIREKDPNFWTDKMESDFKEILDYRLS